MDVNELRRNAGKTDGEAKNTTDLDLVVINRKTKKHMYMILGLISIKKWGCFHV